MANCNRGEASRMEARPSPTRNSITGKPTKTPSKCGMVLATPKRAPDDASITLLGPGVKAITSAKRRAAKKVWADMEAGPETEATIRQNHPPELPHHRMMGNCTNRPGNRPENRLGRGNPDRL